MSEDELPTGEGLEQAIEQAIEQAGSGPMPAVGLRAALDAATLMLSVVDRADAGDEDAALPLVIEVEGVDYGVAFTSARQWDAFSTQTAFVLLDGANLEQTWPQGLGLAINPGASPSVLLSPENLQQIFGSGASGGAPAGQQTVPAGSTIRVGAPDPGLPTQALDALRAAVRADDTARAAYQLALAVGDGPIELVVGVEAAPPHTGVAERFSENVSQADAGFVGIAFVDLDGSLLELAREASSPIA